MPAHTRLFPPVSIKEILEDIGSFTDQEFDLLAAEVCSPAAFDNSSERCDSLSKNIDKDSSLLTYIFGALEFLYKEIRRKSNDEAKIKLLLDELVVSLELSDAQKITNRLVKLMSRNENAERREKIGRLKRGFISNAVGFSSFVDLRPDFATDRTTINGFVPLVQFRISVDSDNGEERSLVFQLDERALEKLSEAVNDVQKKLDAIKRDAAVSVRISRE